MTRDVILAQVRSAMAELFEDVAREEIHPAARLVEDLDLDSLDLVELTTALSKWTGAAAREGEVRKLRTIADVIDLAQRQLAQRKSTEGRR